MGEFHCRHRLSLKQIENGLQFFQFSCANFSFFKQFDIEILISLCFRRRLNENRKSSLSFRAHRSPIYSSTIIDATLKIAVRESSASCLSERTRQELLHHSPQSSKHVAVMDDSTSPVASLLADIELSSPGEEEGDDETTENNDIVGDASSIDSLGLYKLGISTSSLGESSSNIIDMVLATAGPPPASLTYPSLALADAQRFSFLAHVDYAKISVERMTFTKDAAPMCHQSLDSLGRQAQLYVKYELPPLASAPDFGGSGGAVARLEQNQVYLTIGKVIEIFPLPDSNERTSEKGKKRGTRAQSTSIRRRKKKLIRPSENAKTNSRDSAGGRTIDIQHSNLLAISFMGDLDVREWLEGTLLFHIVCACGSVTDDCKSDGEVLLASTSLPLRDVFASHNHDIRVLLDLRTGGKSEGAALGGALAVRLSLIGGSIEADNIEEGPSPLLPVEQPPYTSLPIPQEGLSAFATTEPIPETPSRPSPLEARSIPHPDLGHEFALVHSCDERRYLPQHCPFWSTQVSSSFQPPAAEADRLECKPTVHPSATRMRLERLNHSAELIQCWFRGCIRRRIDYLDHIRSALSQQQQQQLVPMVLGEAIEHGDSRDQDSPPPPPPPPLTSPSEQTSPPTETDSTLALGPIDCIRAGPSNPLPPSPLSPALLLDCSGNHVQNGGDKPQSSSFWNFSIHLGFVKGLREAVSIWYDQEPRTFQLYGTPISSSGVVVSYSVFEDLDGLERNVMTKVLSLQSSTNNFDSEETFSVPEASGQAMTYLHNEAVKFKLFFVPSMNSKDIDFCKQTLADASLLVCSATLPLLALLRYEGGCRKDVAWKVQGWLEDESIGAVEVTIVREGMEIDQLPTTCTDILSTSCDNTNSIADWMESREGNSDVAAEECESLKGYSGSISVTVSLGSNQMPSSCCKQEEGGGAIDDISSASDEYEEHDEKSRHRSLCSMMDSLDGVRTRLLESFDNSSKQATTSKPSIACNVSEPSIAKCDSGDHDAPFGEERESPEPELVKEDGQHPEQRITPQSIGVGTSPIVEESPKTSRGEDDGDGDQKEETNVLKTAASQTELADEASRDVPTQASSHSVEANRVHDPAANNDACSIGSPSSSDSSSACTSDSSQIIRRASHEEIAPSGYATTSGSLRRRLLLSNNVFACTAARTSSNPGTFPRYNRSDTDRISSIMSSYLRPSLHPRLGGRALYSSSSSSDVSAHGSSTSDDDT